MKVWAKKLVPIGFALAGVPFLVPAVKAVIKGLVETLEEWDEASKGWRTLGPVPK
jgi:hypothetical protein